MAEYLGNGAEAEIGTDASPHGLGGWLSINGKIARYFSCRLTAEDSQIFAHELGSCLGQQTWESLAILVAARIWRDCFANRRLTVKVRGDNVGSLTLVVKMRPSSWQQAIISREIALLTSLLAFPPAVTHTPGIAHKLADALSRNLEPDFDHVKAHPILIDAERTQVPLRPRSWYKALEEHSP